MDELTEKLKAKYKDGNTLVLHNCSMCNYPCGFSWFNGQLAYDTGCDCTYGAGGFQPREDSELDFYLNNPRWLEKFKAAVAQLGNQIMNELKGHHVWVGLVACGSCGVIRVSPSFPCPSCKGEEILRVDYNQIMGCYQMSKLEPDKKH